MVCQCVVLSSHLSSQIHLKALHIEFETVTCRSVSIHVNTMRGALPYGGGVSPTVVRVRCKEFPSI